MLEVVVVVVVAITATTVILALLCNLGFFLLIVFQDSRIQHLHLLLGSTTVRFHDGLVDGAHAVIVGHHSGLVASGQAAPRPTEAVPTVCTRQMSRNRRYRAGIRTRRRRRMDGLHHFDL